MVAEPKPATASESGTSSDTQKIGKNPGKVPLVSVPKLKK